MKCDDTTCIEKARKSADGGCRVRLIKKYVAANHRIELLCRKKVIKTSGLKRDPGRAALFLRALTCALKALFVPIKANHATAGSNDIAG